MIDTWGLWGLDEHTAAGRRFTQDYQLIGHDYFPTDVISHYMQRKETGFGDEKAPLYELNNKPPLSQQITDTGYEKPVELFTDGRSGYIGDGHHRIDVARQLGHSHVPVQVFWRKPYSGGDTVSDNRAEPWLKSWLTDMRKGRQTARKLAAGTTPFIARGINIDHPEDDHDLFHAINEHRATPEQLRRLVTHGDTGGAGVFWGTYGGEHGEIDPHAYGNLEDFQAHAGEGENPDLSVSEHVDSGEYDERKQWAREEGTPHKIYAEVPTVLIGQRPKRGGQPWDPEIHNPDNGLMGNSYLDEGEKIPLHEIHYHSGRDWVKVPMPKSTTITASTYDEYAGHHQAPGPGTGFPIHDMHGDDYGGGLGGVPHDWQTHPHYYAVPGEVSRPELKRTQQTYNRVNGNPEEMVDVYRGLPHGNTDFNTGDWVTPSLEYAKNHGKHADDPSQDWPVIKTTVPAKHLWQNGDSYFEMGYHGPSHPGQVV